jgi:hypothetical protein
VAHDEADRPREPQPDGGTQPLPAEPFSERTAGLPQSVTTTTPAPDLSVRGAGEPQQSRAGQDRYDGPDRRRSDQHRPAQQYPEQAQQYPERRYPEQQYPAQQYPQPQYAEQQYPAQSQQYPAPDRRYPEQGPDQYPARPYPEPGQRPSRGRRGMILTACALVGVGIGLGAQRLVTAGDDGKAAGAGKATVTAAPTPVTAQVSGFSPKGNGFRQQGSAWKTETYTTAKFGNLKPGVGLVLDLGTARALRSVKFNATTGPLTVELRAADSKPSALDDTQRVGAPASANGSTTLPATAGGSHRYWMVWVTSLAPSGGGFAAEIAGLTAQG